MKTEVKKGLVRAIALAIVFCGSSRAQGTRAAFNVSVVAVDDNAAPVPNADVGFSWGVIGAPKPDSDYARKLTDDKGEARFEGRTASNVYAYGGRKEGYYTVSGVTGRFETRENGRWKPWQNRLRVVLKRIRNPIPMYAKRIEVLVPEVGKPVGYDLLKGDWISPYGRGITADFEFTVEGRYESKLDYSGRLTVRVPGTFNGIVAQAMDHKSELKMLYEAPDSGYAESVAFRNGRETGSNRFSRFVDDPILQSGFIFRVRAIVDSDGRIVRADYGKIHGPVFFQTFEGGRSRVGFTYYYNPDHTRNIEFDPKCNLFTNLKDDERVIEP